MINSDDFKNPEFCREYAKKLLATGDPETREYALSLLIKAMKKGDAQALFLVADFIIRGEPGIVIKGDRTETAKLLMADSAQLGYLPAQALLNRVFDQKYHRTIDEKHFENHAGPLVDFDGNVIKIDRKGVFIPVDAALTYDEEQGNVLTLCLDVHFSETICSREDSEKLKDIIVQGIKLWEGDYTVFGGQHLKVKTDVTQSQKKFDNVRFIIWNNDLLEQVTQLVERLPEFKQKKQKLSIFKDRRANTFFGNRWKAHNRKMIFLMEDNQGKVDYDDLMHTVKHEFGHVLGLGDLYSSLCDDLEGVAPGTYYELDCYHIGQKAYYSVMCRHVAPVTNNDIEMIVLAFMENEGQAYQKQRGFKSVSHALGKGN